MEGLDVVCVFPSRLQAKLVISCFAIVHLCFANLTRYVEHYLTTTTVPFPLDRYPTIGTLAEAVLRRFSARSLSSRRQVGTGGIVKPVEATYQDEFYRCIHQLLGFSTNVSSEWTGGGLGRIDFRITEVAWGVELLRDGDRLKAHCERFVGHGTYTPWIHNGWLQDWLIIDCRTTMPQPYGKLSSQKPTLCLA